MAFIFLTNDEWVICFNQLKKQIAQIQQTHVLNNAEMSALREHMLDLGTTLKEIGIDKHTVKREHINKIEVSINELGMLFNDTQNLVNAFTNLKQLHDVIKDPETYKLIPVAVIPEFKAKLLSVISPAKEIIMLFSKSFQTTNSKRALAILNYISVTLMNYAKDPTDIVKLLAMQESILALDTIKPDRTLEILSGCLKGIAATSLMVAGLTTSILALLGSSSAEKLVLTRIIPLATTFGEMAVTDLAAGKINKLETMKNKLRMFDLQEARAKEVETKPALQPQPSSQPKLFSKKKSTPPKIIIPPRLSGSANKAKKTAKVAPAIKTTKTTKITRRK
jgi:hypothetical protein